MGSSARPRNFQVGSGARLPSGIGCGFSKSETLPRFAGAGVIHVKSG
jgi:hypothetical protein